MSAGFLKIHPQDNVAVALRPLKPGSPLEPGVKAGERINPGHKVALKPIKTGEPVIKYGQPIGRATLNIEPGGLVHSHNLKTSLSSQGGYTYQPFQPRPGLINNVDDHFEGYLRANGKAGIRNEIWIINTVGCSNQVSARLTAMAREKWAAAPVDGFFNFEHGHGCSQMGRDLAITKALLAGFAQNPNTGGVLVVGLGCEINNIPMFKKELSGLDSDRVRFLNLQDHEDELAKGMDMLSGLVAMASSDKRKSLPVSKLVMGLECGGSDGFSGITANPLTGLISDHLTGLGGIAVLSEVPEMFGAEHLLMNRAVDEAVFKDTVRLINNYKAYFKRYGQVVYENPSPGNKEGGITTLEEKSLGCIQKGGSALVTDVLNYGEQSVKPGLNLLDGPGNDLVSVTALTASGAQLILFTTGRGTPLGAPVPTLKIASNSDLARRKANWTDFDAGALLDGLDMQEAAAELWNLLLDVASGRRKTKNEELGYRQICLMKDGVIM